MQCVDIGEQDLRGCEAVVFLADSFWVEDREVAQNGVGFVPLSQIVIGGCPEEVDAGFLGFAQAVSAFNLEFFKDLQSVFVVLFLDFLKAVIVALLHRELFFLSERFRYGGNGAESDQDRKQCETYYRAYTVFSMHGG